MNKFKNLFSQINPKKRIIKPKKNLENKGKGLHHTKLRGNKSIGTNLILLISLTIVSFSLVVGLITYKISKDSIIKASDELLLNKALDSASLVDAEINQFTTAIEPLGHFDFLGDPDIPWNEKVEILKSEKHRSDLSGIGIADTKGNLLLDDNSKIDVSDYDLFKESMEGNTFFAKPFHRKESGKMEIGVSVPLFYKNNLVGSIIAFQNADSFYEITGNIHIAETGYAYILDEEIDVVSHPTVTSGATAVSSASFSGEHIMNFRGLVSDASPSSKESISNIIADMTAGIPGIGVYEDDSTSFHLGYAQVPSKDWTVVVSVDEKEILEGLNLLKITMIIIIILSLIASLIIPYAISRKLIRGISEMSNRTKNLADFNLSLQMDNRILNRNDELGTMGRSIQSLIGNLKDFAHKIQYSSQSVAASSQELAAITEESLASSTSVAEAAGHIEESSQLQLEEIQKVSTDITYVSNGFNGVLKEIKSVDSLSHDASNSTELGKEVIDEVIEQMANIKSGTLKVKDSLEDINNSSNEMDQILIVIQAIAEQTNLLALNASIEAARAGEEGRGFAVVADEIRKLADQTKNSTDEIANILRNNNSLIRDANSNMELSNGEVDRGISKVNETKSTFDDIARIIQQVAEGMENSTKTIGYVENSINSAISSAENAENITIQVADQIHNVSAATQEQMASIEEVTASTESLARLADELQELIQHMKL